MSQAAVALVEVLGTWVARSELWRPLVRHDVGERTYFQLHRDEHVELYLICWMTGHDTGFHDNDCSAAAIAVLEGRVSEERLSLGGPVARTLAAGDRVTIPREAIHRVRHIGDAPAVSLHAYSPPLHRVGAYEVADDGSLLRRPRSADQPLEAVA